MKSAVQQALIDAVRAGRPEAQRELYDLLSARVYAFCLRYARDRTEASDLAQEVWMRAFRKIDLYDGTGAFEGWLRRLAANCCLKAIQRRRLRFEEIPEVLPQNSAVAPEALADLQADELLTYIAELPDGYREVFNLVAVEGFSHRSVAERLDISEGTSRSKLTRARSLLQRRLRKLNLCL